MTLAHGFPAGVAGSAASRSFDAVFRGDATGRTDVSAALSEFLGSHDGQRVALKRGGVYRVTQVAFTARDLTVDFRGARLAGKERGVHGILRLIGARRVVLNDARVHGTGYAWGDDDQYEHGIHIDGGRDITLRRPVTRDTRGDGIYVGYRPGVTRPSTGVRILQPDVERASRNGIAPVAGEVTIRGGHIDRVGLHGVDFEPNGPKGARSIRGIVEDIDIRRVGDLDTGGHDPFAVAVVSRIRTPRMSLRIRSLTGDRLRMRIEDVRRVAITANESDRPATVTVRRSESVTFRGNTRLRRR